MPLRRDPRLRSIKISGMSALGDEGTAWNNKHAFIVSSVFRASEKKEFAVLDSYWRKDVEMMRVLEENTFAHQGIEAK